MNKTIIIWKSGIIIFLVLFLSVCVAGQSPFQIDSLKDALGHVKQDTEKVYILLSLSEAYNDTGVVKALYYANEALQLSEESGWTTGKMFAELAIGDCYPQISEYDIAIQHYNIGLSYAREMKRQDAEIKILEQIAEAYSNAGDFDANVRIKLEIIALAKQLGNEAIEYKHLNFLAGACYDMKRYDESICYYRQCIDLARENGKKVQAGLALNNLAGLYIDLKNADSARPMLLEAREILSPLHINYLDGIVSVNFCELFQLLHKYDSALVYGQRALAIGNELHHFIIEQASSKLLSEIYETAGKPALALAYRKKYDEVNDSMRDEQKTLDNAKKVLKADFSRQTQIYEMEKRTSERVKRDQRSALVLVVSALLVAIAIGIFIYLNLLHNRQKNKTISVQAEQLKLQNVTIEKALKEKEILLKEVHHRVKNNLQMISSLLELQAHRLTDENARAALSESQARVMSMAIIHRKLYKDEMLDAIDFKTFADDLFLQIKNMSVSRSQLVQLVNELPDKYFEIDIATPLGLILNELVTNSFKYACSGAGPLLIMLRLIKKDKYHVLEYRDNGQGLPADMDPEKSKSMGLRIIYRLSNQLGGFAEYAFDNGSIFSIFFLA